MFGVYTLLNPPSSSRLSHFHFPLSTFQFQIFAFRSQVSGLRSQVSGLRFELACSRKARPSGASFGSPTRSSPDLVSGLRSHLLSPIAYRLSPIAYRRYSPRRSSQSFPPLDSFLYNNLTRSHVSRRKKHEEKCHAAIKWIAFHLFCIKNGIRSILG